uniref:NR LBD domain-containing protein n=1 Tax=Meloidogyne javanica TaxID=6303 RepID=A0A915M0P6_MELJA
MGMYIQTTKGRQPEKVLEIQTMIQNKRRELASKGKYVQGRANNCAVEGLNFVDLQKSLIAAQNKQSLDYLLTVEQNACRTKDSGIDECYYNSSCNSLASLLTRKENLIAMKHENIYMKKYPKSGRDNPIEGYRVFTNRPKILTDLCDDSMVSFNRLQLSKEEFVLLRAILSSHFVSSDLSQYGRQLLLAEAEKYSDMLMKMLQNHYGPLAGARRYAELLHLIEFCFNCANNHSLFLNYMAYVKEQNNFHKSMPEAFANLCLGCKT